MSGREHPEWMYSVPDARTAHIAELEAALLESNDTAARLRHIALGVIGANYDLDHEHAERFLSEWIADPSAWPVKGLDV